MMNIIFRETVVPSDADAVREIVTSTGNFSKEEIEIAVELVDERLAKGEESGYFFLFGELEGRVVTYACFGPIPATKESYDLYWIATHQDYRGKGIGRQTQHHAEQVIARMGGHRIYIETSSRPDYAGTRHFYEICNCQVAAILTDFYAPGDSKYIFVKVV